MSKTFLLLTGAVAASRSFLVAAIAAAFLLSVSVASAAGDGEVEERPRDLFGEAWDSGGWPEELKEAFRQTERNRPPPREFTPEEIAEARQRAEERAEAEARALEARTAEIQRTLRPTFPAGEPDPDFLRHDNAEWRARLTARRDQAIANRAQVEVELDAIAEKYGIDRHRTPRGTLVGDTPHGPIFMTPQGTIGANSTSAAHLWPSGLYSWQIPGLSRNLTGAGVRASIWEANEAGGLAGILTSHGELSGGRAVQVDGASPSNHATAVASVIIGGGNLDLFRDSNNLGKLLRGTAYQGELWGHNLIDFITETGNAVLDGQSFSNHSYGVPGGWIGAGGGWWYWHLPAFTEDPRLGAYSSAVSQGTSSADLDAFVVASETYLPVYAAGNQRNSGPGRPVTYLIPDGMGGLTTSTATRVWTNGDDGYDTVVPPGTAKNVLTVGSITDINFSTGTFGISGFTGTGPTDDGRIKPDLVAVGQRNSGLGFGNSLFAAHKANTNTYYNGILADGNGIVNLEGTSFAAPSVAGGLMLAEQRRNQLLPAAGPLLASTWRAAAIHTVLDYGAPGPNYLTGWGIFHAERLVSLLEEDAALGRGDLIKEFTVVSGVAKSFYVRLPAGIAGEITLAWNDPAGTPAPFATVLDDPTPMLVNDLDLVAEDADTETLHLPWILDPDLTGKSATVRGAPATRGVDDRNNVEKITIDTVQHERRLKVTVAPNGALQGGSQKVSLVLSGVIPVAPVTTASGLTQNPQNINEYGITFSSDPGAWYTLETRPFLETGSWSVVSSVQAEESLTTVLTEINPAESRRFWRIRRGD